MRIVRRETAAITAGVALVAAAFVLPRLNLGIVPLIHAAPERFAMFAGAAPISGWWQLHLGWGTGPAIVIGVAAVLWGPTSALRLSWRALP